MREETSQVKVTIFSGFLTLLPLPVWELNDGRPFLNSLLFLLHPQLCWFGGGLFCSCFPFFSSGTEHALHLSEDRGWEGQAKDGASC